MAGSFTCWNGFISNELRSHMCSHSGAVDSIAYLTKCIILMSFSHHCYDYFRDLSPILFHSVLSSQFLRYLFRCLDCPEVNATATANTNAHSRLFFSLCRSFFKISLLNFSVSMYWCSQLKYSNMRITKRFFAELLCVPWGAWIYMRKKSERCSVRHCCAELPSAVMWSCDNKWQKDCYRQ